MKIFIKHFYILSILISINSSMLVHITIDKSGLKSEPKKFESKNKNGQFRVKMAKWSNGQWEYDPEAKSEITKSDHVSLDVPEKWAALFLNTKNGESFILAVKIEMAGNKSIKIKPIPFILSQGGQRLTLHLKQMENDQIGGSCSGPGQNQKIIEQFLIKIEKEMSSSLDLTTNRHKNVQQLQSQSQAQPSSLPQPRQNLNTDLTQQDLFRQQQLLAQKMAINQIIKNANYFPEAENIQQKYHKNAEGSQNAARRHGKGLLMPEIGGEGRRLENWPQTAGPKLMHSAFNVQNRQSWKVGGQYYLGQNIQKHGKGNEIGDENRPVKKHKFVAENWSPFPSHWEEHQQERENPWNTENLAATGKQIINQGMGQIDEYGGGQNELAQFISSGFTRQDQGNIPTMNAAVNPIGRPNNLVESMWQENASFQKSKTSSTFDEAAGPQYYGKTSSIVAAASGEHDFKAIGHKEEESDLSSIFHEEKPPNIEQILSESSNLHSAKSD